MLAVDWSGAADLAVQRKTIAVAEWDGHQAQLACGRTRDEVIARVAALAGSAGSALVGFDFSFSFPAWFVREAIGPGEGVEQAMRLWRHVAAHGERWLAGDANFFGRKGPFARQGARYRREPGLLFRETEQWVRAEGCRPSSTFQVGGVGAVGTGSLRGMPSLLSLVAAGFAVWPFQAMGPYTVVEIYPARFMRRGARPAGVSTDPAARRRAVLEAKKEAAPNGSPWRRLAAGALPAAAASQDAFDALLSLMAMVELLGSSTADELRAAGPLARVEGEIWPRRLSGIGASR